MIIPDRHNERHARAQRRRHRWESALGFEAVGIAESSLLSIAIGGRDGIVRFGPGDCREGVRDDFAALDVEALDFCERAADELSDDCEDFGGVDDLALAVEGGVTLAVTVEVASVGVTHASITCCRVGASAGVTVASGLGGGCAGVRCISCRC